RQQPHRLLLTFPRPGQHPVEHGFDLIFLHHGILAYRRNWPHQPWRTTLRIRWLLVSPIEMAPSGPTTAPCGRSSPAATAGAPSTPEPWRPPAIVVTMPAWRSISWIAWFSVSRITM